MKYNYKKKLNVLIFGLLFALSTCIQFTEANLGHVDQNSLGTPNLIEPQSKPFKADVSGNELYAEQIAVTIGGESSLISQSYITNDTNIFAKVDLSDPAFSGSSFMMSVSNGIDPNLSPSPASQNILGQTDMSYQSLQGFLYYDNKSDYQMVSVKRERALSILKETFEMDLVLLDVIEDSKRGYYYPFVGYFPKWNLFIDVITSNIPDDGY
jgi:hypothetical protein